MDEEYHDLLVRETRAEAAGLTGPVPAWLPHRETMRAVKTLIVCDLTTDAPPGTADTVTALLDHLTSLQGPTGLFDGDNLVSPPDSSFTINDLCLVLEILATHPHGSRWAHVVPRLRAIAERAADALRAGGVHTPNHRWELASALAGLRHVLGDQRLTPRIEQWLAEGVDIDDDGFYSERSAIYAAVVSNPSLVTLARLLPRPGLLEPVRANLRTLPSLVDDDGEVVTVHSRRQDQRETFGVHQYLSLLRRFAVTDRDPALARLARLGARPGLPEPSRHLAEALVDPLLLEPLPASGAAPQGRTDWPTVGLVRLRDGHTTTTLFAGSDTRATGRIASGLSNSATVFQLRHGAARLHALRVSPQFFDMGAFRPASITGDGTAVLLTEHRASGYYQPLAPELHRGDGRYPLTDDGRFFARMDFPAREVSALELTTELRVEPVSGGADLELRLRGPRTRVAVELVFGDGTLTGTEPHPSEPGTGWLCGGSVRLRQGDDTITVHADGHDQDLTPRFDDGELITYVGGSDRIPGQRVLLGAWSDRPVRLRLRTGSGT